MRSAWGGRWPSRACRGRAAGLRQRALLSPGVESPGSCCGPGAPPETGGKPSARESSPACLSACLNHAGFSVQLAKWRPWKCICVGLGWLQGGKKCRMTLGDSSLTWIQVISFESEVDVPQPCPSLADPMGYTAHGILLQGIVPVSGLNPGLPHCRQILSQLSHQGSPTP